MALWRYLLYAPPKAPLPCRSTLLSLEYFCWRYYTCTTTISYIIIYRFRQPTLDADFYRDLAYFHNKIDAMLFTAKFSTLSSSMLPGTTLNAACHFACRRSRNACISSSASCYAPLIFASLMMMSTFVSSLWLSPWFLQYYDAKCLLHFYTWYWLLSLSYLFTCQFT